MKQEEMLRFRELTNKIDNGVSTKAEEEEYHDLWVELQNEEESNRLNTYCYGY